MNDLHDSFDPATGGGVAAEVLGTRADPSLSPRVRRALDENWSVGAGTSAVTRPATWDGARMWQTFQPRLAERSSVPTRRAVHPPRSGWFTAGTTAVLFAMALAAVGLHLWRQRPATTSWTMRPPMATYVTQAGQIARLTLADGSRVVLAPHTTLQIEAEYGTRARTVTLRGEAYFDVAHTSGAPFVVRTGPISARVLGTTFTMVSDTRHVRVAVATGKVEVSAATSHRPSITLTAGTVGDVTDSSATSVAVHDVADYSAWTSGLLVFRSVPVRDVLARMSAWYGARIRLSDSSLAGQPITTGISTTSRAEALATLSRLLDVEASITSDVTGDVITLHPRRRAKGTPRVGRTSAPRFRMPILDSSQTEVGR